MGLAKWATCPKDDAFQYSSWQIIEAFHENISTTNRSPSAPIACHSNYPGTDRHKRLETPSSCTKLAHLGVHGYHCLWSHWHQPASLVSSVERATGSGLENSATLGACCLHRARSLDIWPGHRNLFPAAGVLCGQCQFGSCHSSLRRISLARLGLGTTGTIRFLQGLRVCELAGYLLFVWSLAFWLSGYIHAQSRSRQSNDGLGKFLADEVSDRIRYWTARWSPALANRADLRVIDPALPD